MQCSLAASPDSIETLEKNEVRVPYTVPSHGCLAKHARNTSAPDDRGTRVAPSRRNASCGSTPRSRPVVATAALSLMVKRNPLRRVPDSTLDKTCRTCCWTQLPMIGAG
jgi:hypothetical protein